MKRSKGADFFQVFLLDLEVNLFVEHRRRCSVRRREIGRRSILLRRISWSGLSLPYLWRRSSMISSLRISCGPMWSLHQRLDTPQFEFATPLVALLWRGLQDKEQVERLTPEAEFVVRYAATIGGRNLELAQVCLSKVCWLI